MPAYACARLRQLLANLWARQAALQCAFNQESIDLLIPTYTGSIACGDFFNPAKLSAVVVQVKYKSKADTAAEDDIRPLGISRDLDNPLPYFTLLMELGNESNHGHSRSRLKPRVWGTGSIPYSQLVQDWVNAVEILVHHKALSSPKAKTDPMKKAVTERRKAMDNYDRYSLSARGSSDAVYGILKAARLAEAFAALLKVAIQSPTELDRTISQMRPLERFSKLFGHTDWMSEYCSEE